LTSVSLFSGFSSVSTVPAGSFENAALVGAKYRERSRSFERLDQASGLHRGHQRGVVGRVYGVIR